MFRDMGRPLVAHYSAGEGQSLRELWDESLYLEETAAQSITAISNVDPPSSTGFPAALYSVDPFRGWDGPYLQVSSEVLFDGFGETFLMEESYGGGFQSESAFVTSAAQHRVVANLGSYGAEAKADSAQTPADWSEEDVEMMTSAAATNVNCGLHVEFKVWDYRNGLWVAPLANSHKL